MRNNNKVRAALTAAVVLLGVAAAGTGVAFATTSTPRPPAAAQATPATDGGQPPDTNALIKQMDQMMQRMVQNLPVDQRDAAIRMHEQMRPVMARMMAGDTGTMGQMNEGDGMTAMMGR